MSRLRPVYLLYAALLLAATAAALATRAAPVRPASPAPSVKNPGPAGAMALFTYLQERGRDVSIHDRSLTEIPPGTRTVVVAMPTSRELDREEVEALLRFADEGGRVVYLASRQRKNKALLLDEALGISEGPQLPAAALSGPREDPGGATAYPFRDDGVLRGVEALRILSEDTLSLPPPAYPIAGETRAAVLWAVPRGKGEILVAAGGDLAENRRLELSSNLQLWDNLAQVGPMLFDEHHHALADPPPLSRGILLFAVQALVVFLAFVLAEGTRLGPPRPLSSEHHRSPLEYVRSLASLLRRAHVEPELAAALLARLRRLTHELYGLPVDLPEAQFAERLAEATGVPKATLHSLIADTAGAQTPASFLAISRRYATLERLLTGRRSSQFR